MGDRKLEIEKHFIFDVDGTLTPSRGQMDLQFRAFFNTFCLVNNVYLVTGSDKSKTVEQITEPTYNLVKRVYNCSGCDVWEGKTHIRASHWILPEDAHEWLSIKLTESPFTIRSGLHFEHRPGMVNYSIVGRNANTEERARYVAYDTFEDERNKIAKSFNKLFPELEARPGGETGIDIAPKGYNKSQILDDFKHNDELHFFGDRMDKAGNDYPLSKMIIDNKLGSCYNVNNYKGTWTILNEQH
jgi:phosphomannomutase